MYHWALLQQCVLKVCRQSTIFNDLSIIDLILKIGSFLRRTLPYFSSSQSNSTPRIVLCSIVSFHNNQNWNPSAIYLSYFPQDLRHRRDSFTTLLQLMVDSPWQSEKLSLTNSLAGSENSFLVSGCPGAGVGLRPLKPDLRLEGFWEFPGCLVQHQAGVCHPNSSLMAEIWWRVVITHWRWRPLTVKQSRDMCLCGRGSQSLQLLPSELPQKTKQCKTGL